MKATKSVRIACGLAVSLLLVGFDWPWNKPAPLAYSLNDQTRSPDSLNYALKKIATTPEEKAATRHKTRRSSTRVQELQTAINKKDPAGLALLKRHLDALGAKDSEEAIALMDLAPGLASPRNELAEFTLNEVLQNSNKAKPARAFSNDDYLDISLEAFLGASVSSDEAVDGSQKAVQAQADEASKERLLEVVELHYAEIVDEVRELTDMRDESRPAATDFFTGI